MSSRSPNHIDRLVGARLRVLRVAENRALADLGADLGISHQQLQKYETGANRMSAGMLWQAAQIFGVRVDAFFDAAPQTAANDHGLAEGLEQLDAARDLIARAMRRSRADSAPSPHS